MSGAMWQWDGGTWRWVLETPRAERPGLFWFFEARAWAGSYLLMGLIALIPIVGAMALFGWYLAVRDNLRAGYWVVPRAGFDYLGRGARAWVSYLVIGLYIWPVYFGLLVGFVLALVLRAPGMVVALPLITLVVVYLAFTVLLGYLTGAILAVADRWGIGAGCNPAWAWSVAGANVGASWRVFGGYLLGYMIAIAVGTFIPFGSVFILPAAYLMAAPAQAELNEAARERAASRGAGAAGLSHGSAPSD
jgi:hypothetical protein